VYDGYVVCEEFADLVMDAWNQEQENKVGIYLGIYIWSRKLMSRITIID
jgi:hypothetical protein